jgi:hypothetical protein
VISWIVLFATECTIHEITLNNTNETHKLASLPLGGTVRLVTLPLEAHGYAARETIEHVLYEMIGWFGNYVKNASPRVKQQTASTER